LHPCKRGIRASRTTAEAKPIVQGEQTQFIERRDGRKSAPPPTKHPLTAGAKNMNWSGREGEMKPNVQWTFAVHRTPGRPEIRSPTNKTPANSGCKNMNWSGREDLNLRPLQPHCSALPDCATPRKSIGKIARLEGGLSYLSSQRDGMLVKTISAPAEGLLLPVPSAVHE
jgi:hypothetical protein